MTTIIPVGGTITKATLSLYREGHFDTFWTYDWSSGGAVRARAITEKWEESGVSAGEQNDILWDLACGEPLFEQQMSSDGWYHFDVTDILNEEGNEGILLTAKASAFPTPGKSGMLSTLLSSEHTDKAHRPKLEVSWDDSVSVKATQKAMIENLLQLEGRTLVLRGESTDIDKIRIYDLRGQLLFQVSVQSGIVNYSLPEHLGTGAIVVVIDYFAGPVSSIYQIQ